MPSPFCAHGLCVMLNERVKSPFGILALAFTGQDDGDQKYGKLKSADRNGRACPLGDRRQRSRSHKGTCP